MRYLFPATLIVLALTGALALASERTVPATYYVNGKPVTSQKALDAALHDIGVLQCKPVFAMVSKNGNSISLKSKNP